MTIVSKNTSFYVSLFLFHILVTFVIIAISNNDYLSFLHNSHGFWNFTRDSSVYHREALQQVDYLNNYEWLKWYTSFAAHQNVKIISLTYWITGYSNPLSFAVINTLTWVLSVILIFKSSQLLFPKIRYLPFLIIIFFIQPSILFNSTQLLRDTFFLLGICFFIYGWVILEKDHSRWHWFFCMLLAFVFTISMRSYLFPILIFSLIGYMSWVIFKKKWMIFPFIVLISLLFLYNSGVVNPRIDFSEVTSNEIGIQKLMLDSTSQEDLSYDNVKADLLIKHSRLIGLKSSEYKSRTLFLKQRINEKLYNRTGQLEELKRDLSYSFSTKKTLDDEAFVNRIEDIKQVFSETLFLKFENADKQLAVTIKDFLSQYSNEVILLKLKQKKLLDIALSKINVSKDEVDQLKSNFIIELEAADINMQERMFEINETANSKKLTIEKDLKSILSSDLDLVKNEKILIDKKLSSQLEAEIAINNTELEALIQGSQIEIQDIKIEFKNEIKELKRLNLIEINEFNKLSLLDVSELKVLAEEFESDNKPFLSEMAYRLVKKVGVLRYDFINSTYYTIKSSGIDHTVHIAGINSFLTYFPRAVQISFLAPFPSDWLRDGREVGKIGSIIAGFEMILWYAVLTGFFYLCFVNLFIMKPLIPAFVCSLITMILLGYAVPNVGAIFRLRQSFMLPFFIFGFYGLHMLFNKFYVKYFCD